MVLPPSALARNALGSKTGFRARFMAEFLVRKSLKKTGKNMSVNMEAEHFATVQNDWILRQFHSPNRPGPALGRNRAPDSFPPRPLPLTNPMGTPLAGFSTDPAKLPLPALASVMLPLGRFPLAYGPRLDRGLAFGTGSAHIAAWARSRNGSTP